MEFRASIRTAADADLGEEKLARELAGRASISDDEYRHAWLLGAPEQRPESPRFDVGRGERFGKETDADTQDGEALRLVEMFRESGDPKAETMTRAIGGEHVG